MQIEMIYIDTLLESICHVGLVHYVAPVVKWLVAGTLIERLQVFAND